MIYVRLISGLGNQLFQYAMGRRLSLELNVPLKLDLSFYESQTLRSYRLDKYLVNAEIANEKEIERLTGIYGKQDIYSKVFRRIESRLSKHRRRIFKQENWWSFEPELFRVSSPVYLDGYWQHHKYFEQFPAKILEELSVKDTSHPMYQQAKNQIANAGESVSVHIRRSDYLTDPNANNTMGVLPLDYYYQAVSHMKANLENPSFFIFSDDQNWVRENLNIDAPVCYVDFDNGQSEYLELELMSKCRHNIIANSSFSWWGAFLNSNREKLVTAPKNWVSSPSLNEHVQIVFPSWHKI